jgi:aryl-alcohol dehydrogenase-like predicted oxidoreductase
VLHQGEDIVPIPGTRRPERIAENLASSNVQLTAEQLAQIDAIAPRSAAVGGTLIG